jgi:hypothetical protein
MLGNKRHQLLISRQYSYQLALGGGLHAAELAPIDKAS